MTTERSVGRLLGVNIGSTERPAAILDTPNSPSLEAEERLLKVYRVAAKLMVEKGFGGTSMGDIAKAMRLTKAGLYHYITGKQDLLFRIMLYAMDEVEHCVIEPSRAVADPEERLREIMRLHICGAIEHGLELSILLQEMNHLNSEQQQVVLGRKQAYRSHIQQALRALNKQGRLRDLDIRIATKHIMNTLVGIARWYPNEIDASEEVLIEQTIEFNIAAVLKRPG